MGEAGALQSLGGRFFIVFGGLSLLWFPFVLVFACFFIIFKIFPVFQGPGRPPATAPGAGQNHEKQGK